jgi:hypothetical protein
VSEWIAVGTTLALRLKIAKLEHEVAQLKKAHIGPKSERSKMPRPPNKPATAEERLANAVPPQGAISAENTWCVCSTPHEIRPHSTRRGRIRGSG